MQCYMGPTPQGLPLVTLSPQLCLCLLGLRLHVVLKLISCDLLSKGTLRCLHAGNSNGNKRPLGLPDCMARSLQQADALHPNLCEKWWRGWLVKRIEKGGESERVMGRSYRGQLHWGFCCGQHFKLCPAASITRAEDLLCNLCTPDHVWCMSGKKVMSLAGHSLAVQLQNAGSLGGFRFQARVVPGWLGALSFYFPETSLCIQVDRHTSLPSVHSTSG